MTNYKAWETGQPGHPWDCGNCQETGCWVNVPTAYRQAGERIVKGRGQKNTHFPNGYNTLPRDKEVSFNKKGFWYLTREKFIFSNAEKEWIRHQIVMPNNMKGLFAPHWVSISVLQALSSLVPRDFPNFVGKACFFWPLINGTPDFTNRHQRR